MSKYLEAAERIATGRSYACCFALNAVTDEPKWEMEFKDWYRASWAETRQLYGHFMVTDGEPTRGNPEIQSRRILAMCFMHTLLEAGDLDV